MSMFNEGVIAIAYPDRTVRIYNGGSLEHVIRLNEDEAMRMAQDLIACARNPEPEIP